MFCRVHPGGGGVEVLCSAWGNIYEYLLFGTSSGSWMSFVLIPFCWLGLVVGARADNQDFELLTVLQGRVLKAIADIT